LPQAANRQIIRAGKNDAWGGRAKIRLGAVISTTLARYSFYNSLAIGTAGYLFYTRPSDQRTSSDKAELSSLSAQAKLIPLKGVLKRVPLRYKAELSSLSAQTKLIPLKGVLKRVPLRYNYICSSIRRVIFFMFSLILIL
jgi:hypothetical protein